MPVRLIARHGIPPSAIPRYVMQKIMTGFIVLTSMD
jgi:hypothetical protein